MRFHKRRYYNRTWMWMPYKYVHVRVQLCKAHSVCSCAPLEMFSSLIQGQPTCFTTDCHRLLIMMLILILLMLLRLMFAFRCCLPISWRQPLTAVAWDSGSCPRGTCLPPLTWQWVFWGLLWLERRRIYENVENGSKTKTIVLAQGDLLAILENWHCGECFEKTWRGQRC